MNRWLLLLCFLTAPAWAQEWTTSLSNPAAGSFPPLRPIKAVYRFGWSGFTAAKADFDFSKASRGQYRLAMNTRTIGLVRTIWRMDSQHTAYCDAQTLRPLRLEQTEIYKVETEMTKVEFSPEMLRRQTKVTPLTKPQEREKRLKLPGIFDLQSSLLFIRSQRLEAGEHYRLIVYPSTGAYLADVEVIGREKLKVAAGKFDAIKCQVRLQRITKKLDLAPHKKFKRAYAWLSDDRDRLLLKIEAEVFVGSVWGELESVEFDPKP